MPGKNRSVGRGAFGAVGAVRSFMSVVKEIDFDEVRDRAEQPPRAVVVAATREAAVEVATAIFGDQPERYIDCRAENGAESAAGGNVDAVIVHESSRTALRDRVRHADRVPVVTVHTLADPAAIERARHDLVIALPDLAPSFGRFFPLFRGAAVKAIVDETSRANAQFALVSNIPAVVPLLGSFVAASADLIVLTKNQVMMAYKIAAIYNRDMRNQAAVLRELAPVVGAGFLWRSIAREATSFIPFAAGTLPKVAIAYAGTYSTGRAIDFYFRFGKKPDSSQIRQFAKQAAELAAQLPGHMRKTADDQPVPIAAASSTKETSESTVEETAPLRR